MQQHGLADGGDTPRHEHRLGLGAGVELEVAAVKEQVLEFDLAEVRCLEGVELVFDGLTDPAHGRLGHLGLGPQRFGE